MSLDRGRKIEDFILNDRIGHGGFGEVWASTSLADHCPVAIKIQTHGRDQNQILHAESQILMNLQDSTSFPRFIRYWEDENAAYLAMERLEGTLKQTTDTAHERRLSLKHVAIRALQMLRPIAALHAHGYVHRGIKPGNFMQRPGSYPPEMCLIDFGLAKVWRNEEGVVPPRKHALGFTGTYRYASIRSHEGVELSCRDDLISFLYIVIEMLAPPLPWQHQEDLDAVVELKKKSKTRLLIGLPSQFQEIQNYIDGLQYEDFPDYDWLNGKFEKLRAIGEREEQLASQESGFSSFHLPSQITFSAEAGAQPEAPSNEKKKKRRCCCEVA
jgi:serine/threonine protein kinase